MMPLCGLAQPVARPVFASVDPPSLQAMATLCAGTDDLRECGKRVEAQQLLRQTSLVTRKERLLTVSLNPSGGVHFLDVGGAEAGESFSFFGFHAIADAVTLYHTKADKLGFFVVLRRSGAGSALPNEPLFRSDGQDFLTVDVCKRDCEQRITWWRMANDEVRRHAEMLAPSAWIDASAAWSPNGSVWVEFATDEGKRSMELTQTDTRWNFSRRTP